MSHTSSISAVQIKSIEALRAAIEELNQTGAGLKLTQDATPRAYYNNQQGMGRAEYVIEVSNSRYDIGLYRQPDGSYQARTDFFGGDIERCLGGEATSPSRREQARMGRLFQLYGVHATIEVARRKGQMVRRVNGPNGKIQLELTGSGI